MVFRYLDSLSSRGWAMLGGTLTGSLCVGVSAEVWRRNKSSRVLSEKDCVTHREVVRYPCEVLNGFDVVVSEYFYKDSPVRLPWSRWLRSCLPVWWRNVDPDSDGPTNGTISEEQKSNSNNSLRSVRMVASSSSNANSDDSITARTQVVRPWPQNTSRYCGMTIEPSSGSNQVSDRGFLRTLVDRSTQQTLVKCRPKTMDINRCDSDPEFLSASYLRNMIAGAALLPLPLPPMRVCCLGVGGGALPMFLQQHFATQLVQVDLVDVEPQVVRAATEHMGLRQLIPTIRLETFVMDALKFLKIQNESWNKQEEIHNPAGAKHVGFGRYDLLLVDVFVGSEPPRHLQSNEFLFAAKQSLSRVGVAAFNLPSPNDDFVKRCTTIFGDGNVFVSSCRHSANSVVFATKSPSTSGIAHRHMMSRCRELQKVHKIPYDLSAHFPMWWSLW